MRQGLTTQTIKDAHLSVTPGKQPLVDGRPVSHDGCARDIARRQSVILDAIHDAAHTDGAVTKVLELATQLAATVVEATVTASQAA